MYAYYGTGVLANRFVFINRLAKNGQLQLHTTLLVGCSDRQFSFANTIGKEKSQSCSWNPCLQKNDMVFSSWLTSDTETAARWRQRRTHLPLWWPWLPAVRLWHKVTFKVKIQDHRFYGFIDEKLRLLVTHLLATKQCWSLTKRLPRVQHNAISYLEQRTAIMHQDVDLLLDVTIQFILDATMIVKMIVPFHLRYH